MKSPNQGLLRSLLVRPVFEYDRRIVFYLYGHMFDFLIKGIRPQILICKYRYSRLFIPWEIHSDEDIDDRII